MRMSADNPLEVLAARVRQGDAAAMAEFRAEVGPAMEFLVRRAMRRRTGFAPLDRLVHSHVAQLSAESDDHPVNRDQWAAEIAQDACGSMVDGLLTDVRASRRFQDTVRF